MCDAYEDAQSYCLSSDKKYFVNKLHQFNHGYLW